MVSLIDIPLVLPIAEWIWGSDDAPTCLSEVPFLGGECLSQLAAKALGILIIVGSMLNKVPIMMNMLKSQSAEGISRNALYGEALVFANAGMYGFLSGHPFTAYGENASLFAQTAVLIFLTWNFLSKTSAPVASNEKIVVAVALAAYMAGIIKFLPKDYWYLLMSVTWPVMLYARGSQVYETFKVKQTGNLSIVTTSMNLVGALIRILTTLKETGDMVVLSGYLLSVSFSLLMFVQHFMYLENTNKIAAAAAEKKEL